MSASIVAGAVLFTPISSNDDGVVQTNSESGTSANLTGDFDLYTDSGKVDSTTLQFNTSAGNASFSSQGPASVTLQKEALTGDWTNLTRLDVDVNDLTINPSGSPSVEVGGSVTELRYRSDTETEIGDGSVDFEYTASDSGTVTINTVAANTQFAAWSPSAGSLGTYTSDGSGEATVSVDAATDAQVYLIRNKAPQIDNSSASPIGGIEDESTSFSIDVSDGNFGSTDESLTATLYVGGQSVGGDTLNSNGTATVTHTISEGGSHSYYWEVTDSFDEQTVSQTFSASVPSTLYIYNESNPDQLIDGTTEVQIRLFGQGDEETVLQETITDGTLDLGTIPADQRYVLTLAADASATDATEYHYRRVVLESVYEQQDVYLLPTSQPSVEVDFSFQDYSGNYAPAETFFFVEKAIRKDFDGDDTDETRYQTIAGDVIGPTGTFPTVLQDEERYRLRIKNRPNQRLLGAFTASRDEIEEITIRGLTLEPPEGSRYAAKREISHGPNGQRLLTFKYRDPAPSNTSALDVWVRYRGNDTIVYEDHVVDVGNYSAYDIPLANDTEYVLEYNATIDGTVQTSSIPIGAGSIDLQIPLDGDWLGGVVVVGLTFVMALGDRRKFSYIATTVVILAAVAMYLGVANISTPLWWLAVVIAVGAHLRVMQTPQTP